MKKLLFLLFALILIVSCGSTREDDPIPTPTTYTLTSTGDFKVKKIQQGSTITPNTDTTLFVNVTNGNVKYKLPNGGSFDGWGIVGQPSLNAESITLSNGTKLTMFKTLNNDGDRNFYFIHSDGTKDDVWVRLY